MDVKSNELKRIRLKLGLTQEQLAELLGMSSKNTICNIEIGNRNPGDLVGIILGVLDDLPEKKAKELIELMKKQPKKQ
jgi:transcriptional regulator with XRE-family HTH domain